MPRPELRRHFVLVLTATMLSACAGGRSVPPLQAQARPAAAGTAATIVVETRQPTGRTVSGEIFGANMGTWYNFEKPFVEPVMHEAGIEFVRFPGGSESDIYHWERGGSLCGKHLGYIAPQDSFANFVDKIVKPLHAGVAITLNYGSNAQCNGPAVPSEALGWMALAHRLGAGVKYWTLGNEVYGSYEYDLHTHPHSSAEYAKVFHEQFWPAIKARFPTDRLGVVAGDSWWSWTRTVLHAAKPYDFVEYHYYPEGFHADDASLLGAGIDDFATELHGLRKALRSEGIADSVPIYLGEYNSSYSPDQGKQSVSIVNGLYLGQMLATAIDAGVPASSWWLAFGGTNCTGRGDFSNSLYGFQHFGTFTLFSDDLHASDPNCPGTPAIAGGVPFPTARVLALYQKTVPAGSSVLVVRTPSGLSPAVRAYAYGTGAGVTVVAFNNTLAAASVTIDLAGASGAYAGTLWIYGSPQYVLSRNDEWVGPQQRSLGTVNHAALPLTLAPYSMTVVQLFPQ